MAEHDEDDVSGPVAVTFTARLTPEGSGTRLNASFYACPKGWFRLVFPAFILIMRRQERANMRRIKDALERRPSHSDALPRDVPSS